MKNKLYTISLVFQAVAAVALFLPWFYLEKYYSSGGSPKHIYNISFLGGLRSRCSILGYITLFLMIVSIIMIIMLLLRKNKLSPIGFIPSLAALAAFAAEIFLRTGTSLDDSSGPFAFWSYELSWMSYLVIALQISLTAIIIITRIKEPHSKDTKGHN